MAKAKTPEEIRDKEISIAEERRLFVVKGNDLIRKTKFDLTAQQQKVILYCISKIRPQDPEETEYKISIADLCQVCGIELDDKGGFYYEAIKADFRKLARGEWCKMDNGDEWLISWIMKPRIRKGSGEVSFKFDPDIFPYLFELKKCYTQYRLEKILAFKCKYTIRLYELVRSYFHQEDIDEGGTKKIKITVTQLREMLEVNNSYSVWAEFKRAVIDKAVQEINALNDELHISYALIRTGHKITDIEFTITAARAKQKLEAHKKTKQRIPDMKFT